MRLNQIAALRAAFVIACEASSLARNAYWSAPQAQRAAFLAAREVAKEGYQLAWRRLCEATAQL